MRKCCTEKIKNYEGSTVQTTVDNNFKTNIKYIDQDIQFKFVRRAQNRYSRMLRGSIKAVRF